MESLHKQEKVLQNFQFDGASAQLVEWTETLWCGKVKYAPNCTDEPDVEKLMEEFVAQGKGIIMVSSELPEVIGMSDQIIVMREGRMSATLTDRSEFSEVGILSHAVASGNV